MSVVEMHHGTIRTIRTILVWRCTSIQHGASRVRFCGFSVVSCPFGCLCACAYPEFLIM